MIENTAVFFTKSKFTLFFLAMILMFTTSCKKYDEGPTISLRFKKDRVVGKWHTGMWLVNKYEQIMMIDTSRRAEFTKDWKYTYHEYNSYTKEVKDFGGTWAFRDKKEQILIGLPTGIASAMSYELWDIKRLKDKEMWLEKIVYGFPNSTLYEWRLRAD